LEVGIEVKRLYVKVEYADKNITAQIEPYLEKLVYKDNLEGETADTLEITLDDSQGLFSGPLYPIKGSALYFEFGYDANNFFTSAKGFLIDEITVEGGGTSADGGGSGNRLVGTVVLTASANQPGKAIHTKTTKAWTNTTLEGVASAIAQKHGLDLVFECDKKISLTRLDQFNKSDMKQIKELAEKYGLSFSVKAGKADKGKPTLVIADMEFVAKKSPVFILSVSDCTSFSFEDSVAPNTKGRYVRYFDPVKKELVDFDYDRLKGKVKDKLTETTLETVDGKGQQDRAVVRESLEVFAKKQSEVELEAKITLPGNPGLLAGVVIDLPQDQWAYYGGKWTISASEHDFSVSGGYKTTLTLKKYGG